MFSLRNAIVSLVQVDPDLWDGAEEWSAVADHVLVIVLDFVAGTIALGIAGRCELFVGIIVCYVGIGEGYIILWESEDIIFDVAFSLACLA